MARQTQIQYIQLYTQGSAARQLEPAVPERRKPKTKLPKPRRERVRVLRVDPLAWCGILVAAVMFVLMIVGCVRLYLVQAENARLESYVDQLIVENQVLQDTYESSYDLMEVYEAALEMGLVPVEQVPHIDIRVSEP